MEIIDEKAATLFIDFVCCPVFFLLQGNARKIKEGLRSFARDRHCGALDIFAVKISVELRASNKYECFSF